MRKTLFMSMLLFSTSIYGQELTPPMDFEDQPEDLVTAKYNKQTETFDQILSELKTSDIFAGRLTEISFRGQNYVVDRTGEEVKQKPGKASLLGSLLNDLSTKSEGRLRIKVTQREYDKNGNIKNEDIWEIDAGGSWQAGFDDATGKSHR